MDTCDSDVPLDYAKIDVVNTLNRIPKCAFYIKRQKRCCKMNIFPNYRYCTKHIHEQQPMQIIEKPDDCPVCMDTFHEDDTPLTCGHWVHKSCIIKSGKGQCPICRFELYLSTKEKRECMVYRQRYSTSTPPSSRNGPSGGTTTRTALGAQIDAILYSYPQEVQQFIHDVGLDNIIDSNLYTRSPLLFQNALIAYLESHTGR